MKRLLVLAIAAVSISCTNFRGGDLARPAGWTRLSGNEQEPAGFGLYTYVLLGTNPETADHSMREKQERVIRELLEKTPTLESYGENITKRELNVVLIPLKDKAPATPQKLDQQVAFVLNNYNLARAQQLLANFPKERTTDGPYLVSVLHPLGDSRNDHTVFVDMTPVAGKDEPAWVDEFLNQVKQPQFWNEDQTQKVVKNLRNAIKTLADVSPQVLAAIDTLVKWIAKSPLNAVTGS